MIGVPQISCKSVFSKLINLWHLFQPKPFLVKNTWEILKKKQFAAYYNFLFNSSWLINTKRFHVLHDAMTGIQTMRIDMFDFSKFKVCSESASLVVSKIEAYLENRYAVHLPTNFWQFPISLKLDIQPWCHRFPSHWIYSVFSRAWGGEGQLKNHPLYLPLQLPSSITKCFTA